MGAIGSVRLTPLRFLRRNGAATTFAPMAQLPDLRVVDPLRSGINAETVAIPDIIDSLKAFNEEWGRFEGDMDQARIKELLTICTGAETLWRCMRERVNQVRAEMRIAKYGDLEQKLEKLNARKAALMAHTIREEAIIMAGVSLADTQEWVNTRIAKLQRRMQNTKAWNEARIARKAAKAA